ncbi:MAG: hypothetical protein PHR61_05195 [Candidatus Absconditabacteria bacterium]|nr:hypothetical protein [Candidatus Absconditabacteria bacterium]
MKSFYIVCICLFLSSSFSFAKGIERREISKPEINQQQNFDIQKESKSVKSDLCISGQKLLIGDNFSKKAQESSNKILGLVVLASKINYDTKNLSSLAQDLQNISYQLSEDCVLSDFHKHREQMRATLNLLKIEISSLKKHIANLRNR